jgi:hypothetical protein
MNRSRAPITSVVLTVALLGLYSVRTSRLRVQTEQLAQRVNLYLALGGVFGLPASGSVATQ